MKKTIAERLLDYVENDLGILRLEISKLTELAHKNKMDYLAALKERNDAVDALEDFDTNKYIDLKEELVRANSQRVMDKEFLKVYQDQLSIYRAQFKFVATDHDGVVQFFKCKPTLSTNGRWFTNAPSMVDSAYGAYEGMYQHSLEELKHVAS